MRKDREEQHAPYLAYFEFYRTRRSGGVKHNMDFATRPLTLMVEDKYKATSKGINITEKEIKKCKRDSYLNNSMPWAILYENRFNDMYWIIPDENIEEVANHLLNIIKQKGKFNEQKT